MKRIPLSQRVLPAYTRGEERANCISHAAGAVLGLAALVLCPLVAARHNSSAGVAAGLVFGLALLLLYLGSSIYHGLPAGTAKKVFQILDHCMIFVLIAGSYTPFTLCLIAPQDPLVGWGMFVFVWACALVGIVLNAIDLESFKTISLVCYLVMGWCIIAKGGLLIGLLGQPGFALLLCGGISYTLGAALYVLGQKKPIWHTVFHLFTVLGSLLHVVCIALYVL